MTEHDSGSSGDSSSESSSSSPDSGSGGGIDFSPIVQNLLDDVLASGPSSPIGPPLSGEGEQARRAQFDERLKEILSSNEPVEDRTSLVRTIVESERWFLPTGSDGEVERVLGFDQRVSRALARPLVPGQPERRPDQGTRAPRSLILATTVDPGRPARQVSGRELVRCIPADADGAICFLDADDAVALRREELPLLTQLADSLDLEEILAYPGPGQVEALRQARFYVPAANRELAPSPPGWGEPIIFVSTHPDRAEAKKHPTIELDGRSLCETLAGRDDYIEICVNPSSPVGSGEGALLGVSLPPSFVRGIARGVDTRPGAEPLPARTLAEALLWLDLEGFPWQRREIVAVPRPDESPSAGTTLIEVRTTDTSNWRLVGRSYQSDQRPGPTVSPVFALANVGQLPAGLPAPVPAAYGNLASKYLHQHFPILTPDAFDLGEGQTQILCAGLLAEKLYDQDRWSPSGWLVSKRGRFRAAQLAGWANELLKLIPPGQDRLPRSAILSIDGESFLRGTSWVGERDWIEQQRDRHARSAARRLNIW